MQRQGEGLRCARCLPHAVYKHTQNRWQLQEDLTSSSSSSWCSLEHCGGGGGGRCCCTTGGSDRVARGRMASCTAVCRSAASTRSLPLQCGREMQQHGKCNPEHSEGRKTMDRRPHLQNRQLASGSPHLTSPHLSAAAARATRAANTSARCPWQPSRAACSTRSRTCLSASC